jgi:lysophospholipase L1-like esterase
MGKVTSHINSSEMLSSIDLINQSRGVNADIASLSSQLADRTILNTKYDDVGMGFFPAYYPTDDSKWKYFGSGWIEDYGLGVMGNNRHSTVNGDYATFDFNGTGFVLMLHTMSATGNVDISIDGGTIQTINTTTTDSKPSLYTFNGLTSGNHTIKVTNKGSHMFLLGGYEMKGNKGIRVNTLAKSGGVIANASGGGALMAEFAIQPTLTVIAFTANDYASQTPVLTYKSNLETLIIEAKKHGDVLLISTGIRKPVTNETYAQVLYEQAMYELAIQYEVAYLDMYERWGTDFTKVDVDYQFIFDHDVHPNRKGHEDIKKAIMKILFED